MAASSTEVACLEHVTTRFGDHVVHEDISLCLHEGEILGLVGGSGSGKTTLLLEVIGLLEPTAGRVTLLGRTWAGLDAEETRALRSRCGVLFQGGALFSALTVFDNIAFPLREAGLHDAELVAHLVALTMETVGLDRQAAWLRPASLSGGMTKRAALARALVLAPELLFLDEPTSGLDPSSGDAFVDLVKSLHRELGLTMLLVTHDLDTMVDVCDRVGFLADGRLITIGPLETVLACDHPAALRFFHTTRSERIFGARQKGADHG